MDLIKLLIVFVVIIVLIRFKVPLSGSVAGGALLAAILFQLGIFNTIKLCITTVFSWTTISVILICYMITFLQRMMEQKGDLLLAQKSLSGIFNNRRINTSVAPVFIGLLPSPGAAFIAGDMIKSSCGEYFDKDELGCVTSFYRHIPESSLPTYSSIILATQLSGVAMSSFLIGMSPMLAVLFVLGFIFFLRKIPRETGLPPAENRANEVKNLFASLWPITLAIVLIIAFKLPVYASVGLCIVLYFFIGRFRIKEILPYFASAFERRIVLNTCVVMIFKEILTASNVINQLPEAFSKLPVPSALIFALIFLAGTIISGSTAIITLCIPMAFVAIPDGGTPLLVLLMCCSYAAMQVSPTHLCLTLISEYFDSNFGALVKKNIPIFGLFLVAVLAYYAVFTLIF